MNFSLMMSLGFGLAAICSAAGGYIAYQKGRSVAEGAVLGFLLGPIGDLIVVLLPTRDLPHKQRQFVKQGDFLDTVAKAEARRKH
jgi:hypothetical protein